MSVLTVLLLATAVLLGTVDNSQEASANLTETILSIEEIRFGDRITGQYVTKIELSVPNYVSTNEPSLKSKLETGLVEAVALGAKRSQAQRYGLSSSSVINTATAANGNKDMLVKVYNITRTGRSNDVVVLFAVDYLGSLVPADRVLQDLNQLTDAELTIKIGYAVRNVKAYDGVVSGERSRLWIIGAVIGGVLAVLLLGWCFLFAYYNACRQPTVTYSQRQMHQTALNTDNLNKYTAPPMVTVTNSSKLSPANVKSTKMQTDIFGVRDISNKNDDKNLLVSDDSNYSQISKTPVDSIPIVTVKTASPLGSRNSTSLQLPPLTPDVVISAGDSGPSSYSSYKSEWTSMAKPKLTSSTDAKRMELNQFLGDRWTPHLAADTVQPYILALTPENLPDSVIAHPRPAPASQFANDHGFPEFHSRDLMPKSATQNIPPSQLIRNTFFNEL